MIKLSFLKVHCEGLEIGEGGGEGRGGGGGRVKGSLQITIRFFPVFVSFCF